MAIALLAVTSSAALGWDPDNHKEIATDAGEAVNAAKPKRPNHGKNLGELWTWASKPDDPIWTNDVNHWTLHHGTPGHLSAWEAEIWYQKALNTNIWVKGFAGIPYRTDQPDYPVRARTFGYGSHYIEDSGMPYHTKVFQSERPEIHWDKDKSLDLHSTVEAYVADHYGGGGSNPDPYRFQQEVKDANRKSVASASDASIRLGDEMDGIFPDLKKVVDRCFSDRSHDLVFTRGKAGDEDKFSDLFRKAYRKTSAYLKGAFVDCTGSLVAPESVPLLMNVLAQTSATLLPGGQARIDSTAALVPFAAAVLDTAFHSLFMEEWGGAPDSLKVSLVNPGEPITLVNAFNTGSGIVEHPDLRVIAAALDQPTTFPGEMVGIQAVVFNAGRPPVVGVPVELRVDGATLDVRSVSLDGLLPAIVRFDWTPASPGPHRLEITIDPFNQVDESNTDQAVEGGPFVTNTNEQDNALDDSVFVGFDPSDPAIAVRRVDGTIGGRLVTPSAGLDLPASYSGRTVTLGMSEIPPERTDTPPAEGFTYASTLIDVTPEPLDLLQALTLTIRHSWPPDRGALRPFRLEDSTDTWLPVMLGSTPLAGAMSFTINRTGVYSLQGPDTPTPVAEAAVIRAEAGPGVAKLLWFAPWAASRQAVVCRRSTTDDWAVLATAIPNGEGQIEFEDHQVTAGGRYAYVLRYDRAGSTAFEGEVWLEIPSGLSLALGTVRSNAAACELEISFSLPGPGNATLELLDLLGRRLARRQVGELGVGRHRLTLTSAQPVAAGVYLIRLTRGERSVIAKVAVLR